MLVVVTEGSSQNSLTFSNRSDGVLAAVSNAAFCSEFNPNFSEMFKYRTTSSGVGFDDEFSTFLIRKSSHLSTRRLT